ncbi:unnamed protein product [Lupinus luteus]|uniref:Peroxidase n=1 Tax=Lupinus luteus TaxID=3873 RepID=A0AAV1YG41_LUPLU
MAKSINILLLFSLLAFAPFCHCTKKIEGSLFPQFYEGSCPRVHDIVNSIVAKAFAKDPRMAASLLRLHFHDCFVKGCDGSILLDSSGTIISEKRSNPNRDSARGFEVIDEIKSAIEKECPDTVSCADILALSARHSTVLTGGPNWEVPLGRRDSLGASIQGSHTIGDSRCTSFRQRLYNQSGNGNADFTLDQNYAAKLRTQCPKSGGDQNLFVLDFVTPTKFDNNYFKNLLANKGLLSSDEILLTKNKVSADLVKKYAERNDIFFEQFAKSMIKMGNITPLTGSKGEIRKHCRKINK